MPPGSDSAQSCGDFIDGSPDIIAQNVAGRTCGCAPWRHQLGDTFGLRTAVRHQLHPFKL